MELNKLLTNNSLIYSDLNKYIWINDSFEEHRAAQCLFDYFLKENIYVKGFVTNSKSMISLKMYNKVIYDINTLEQRDAVVFYSFASCVPNILNSEKINNGSLEADEINKAVVCDDGDVKKSLFSLSAFWMFNHFVGKKIYIYGTGIVEQEFAKYLKLLDFDFTGFLTDIESEEKEGDGGEEYIIKYVEEILYEENWYIWTYDKKRATKLNALGLVYFKDYYVKDCRFDVTINQKTVLDINLGNSYIADSEYAGFTIYGEHKENDYKIVTLGGSTTDGTMYPFRSWAQILYEELGKKNITVYNGGVCSYTSGQELVKLLRDVLQLKPDMIIVYDGYNELAFSTSTEYPFASLYLEDIFKYVSTHMETDGKDNELTEVCKGISSQENYFDNWKSNIRSMHAIASERNIRFFSFCQPVLCSKEKKTVREKNMLLSMLSSKTELFRLESFRRYMAQMSDRPEYMYDLSHIFDDEDTVYMDVCHVWENGNQVIAREIKRIICSELFDRN